MNDQPYWLRQTGKPLFPELEWSRPETLAQRGKLLIVGGTAQGFSAPAEAYNHAASAGIGTARVLLPEALRKNVSKLFPEAEYAPSTTIGSFGQTAVAELCDAATWADGVLFPGEIGRNSETSVLMEAFFEKYDGQLTITKDVADFFCDNPVGILHRPDTLLVLAMGQLRRLGASARFPRAFTSDMDMVRLVDALHEFTKRTMLSIIIKHRENYIVAVKGQISTSKISIEQSVWRIQTASYASVWWLQNSSRPFQALTTSVLSKTL